MNMPDAVRRYFEAGQSNDVDAAIATFRDDAVVRDEGGSHAGPAAIRAWWVAARDKYEHRADPVEADGTQDNVVVRAEVSGRFPGSPVLLSFAFTLTDDRIQTLEIS